MPYNYIDGKSHYYSAMSDNLKITPVLDYNTMTHYNYYVSKL